jgi:hypothetical protein
MLSPNARKSVPRSAGAGGFGIVIVTLKEHAAKRPSESDARQSTVVVPDENALPDAGVHTDATGGAPSAINGAAYAIVIEVAEADDVAAITSFGQVIDGAAVMQLWHGAMGLLRQAANDSNAIARNVPTDRSMRGQ